MKKKTASQKHPLSDQNPPTVAELARIVADLRIGFAEESVRHEREVAVLIEQIRLLKSLLYGRSSEKNRPVDPNSLQGFLPFEVDEPPVAPVIPAVTETLPVKAHSRGKPGRRPLPENLPRIEILHDLPEAEKICACGTALARIGEEVTERLDIVPAKVQVIRHVRLKYACRGCEGVESLDGAVKLAPLPPQIIPQGIVTAGLLAHVAIAKFADAIPLYRQEQQFRRLGLEISRGTLAGWLILVAAVCLRLRELLQLEILTGPVINMDETRIQVLREPGRANTSTSHMWVCRGGPPEKPGILFRYFPSRAGKVAEEILKNYRGYLQTDGYIGYEAIGTREGIRHLGCWAHVRRKFMDVLKGDLETTKTGVAHEVIDSIGKLYAIEAKSRQQNLSAIELVTLRKHESKPILDTLKELLDRRSLTTPPKCLLGKAIFYALNQWPLLIVFLESADLRLDNNLAENAIRPFAVGRKNWLFSGSPRGAEASATFFSLIETAKANALEPFAYLKFLFSEIPSAKSDAELKALLPQYADRNRILSQ